MITKEEQRLANTNYLHKDFYQLYPEAIQYIQKYTNRWDPSATNESDPMIVILKYLVSVADKQSYISDKALLENFMPSVTQDSNMRKKCDELGYEMKYYQSATTPVSFMYTGSELSESGDSDKYIKLDAFTTIISNEDEDVSFVLTEPVYIYRKNYTYTANAIEGTYCNAYDNGLVITSNLDDNNRFYLPEASVAENGIFIYREGDDSNKTWKKVSNLNTQTTGTQCYKFGYDSAKKLPYVQFPDDIADLIGEGLHIHYIRTNGVNGNIGAQTLTVLKSESYSSQEGAIPFESDEGEETLTISNISSATNGKDPETIDEAFNSYKKTIGTFDTLVTCRDYQNAIYNLVSGNDNTTPLVSNVLVSDIRDNLTRSKNIVTYTDYGISYKDVSGKDSEGKDLINHFDLMLYPFTPITGAYTNDSYKESFKYSETNAGLIQSDIEDFKTLSHNIKLADKDEIICLKNYYGLKGSITTTYRVNTTEQSSILANIHKALYENFNMRKVDFGEAISIDSIIEVIKDCDSRIKYVNIDIDSIDTRIHVKNNETIDEFDLDSRRDLYIDLVAKNVLGGRIPLFKYDNRFNFDYGQKIAAGTKDEVEVGYPDVVYGGGDASSKKFTKCDTEVKIYGNHLLRENEVVQFIAPNFRTKLSYPAYVNYNFRFSNKLSSDAIPADMMGTGEYEQLITQLTGLPDVTANNFARLDKILPLYRISSTDRTRNPGYLVDGNNNVYKRLTTYIDKTTKYTYRLNRNDPLEWTDEGTLTEEEFNNLKLAKGYLYKAKNGAIADTYDPTLSYWWAKIKPISKNPEGVDAVLDVVPANTEYILKGDDELIINYTDSNGISHDVSYRKDEVEEDGIATNVDYNIIRPNFDLPDTDTFVRLTGKTWAKTSGIPAGLDGMLALSTSEQIDLRDYVKTTLCTPTKCYWIIKNGTIPFDENHEYILGENEYFFYTNDAMTELVTLGSGTKLTNKSSFLFSIDYEKSKIDLDNIASNGLAAFADNPWVSLKFSTSAYLDIQEMQFITLTEGDVINEVDLEDKTILAITNDWKIVTSASFTFSGQSQEKLPTLATGDKWKVRSRLDLNVGPDIDQKLYDNQSITLYYDSDPVTKLILKPFEVDGRTIYPSFSSNYTIQEIGGYDIDLSVKKYIIATGVEEYVNDFAVCIFENVDSTIEYSTTEGTPEVLSTNSIDNNYTKIMLSRSNKATFNVVVPEGDFGIALVYYSRYPYAEGTALVVSDNQLVQYNGTNKSRKVSGKYQYELHSGLNTIMIPKSDTLVIDGNGDKSSIVVISKIRSVNKELDKNGVHNSLLGLNDGESDQLLKVIRDITQDSNGDDKFFYSCPIDNSLIININTEAGETLRTPEVWCDPNNLCNKFVISELDADKFVNQIIIEKTSRL